MGASALAVQRRQGNHVTTALDHELNVPHPPRPWCHAWNQKDARFGVNSQSGTVEVLIMHNAGKGQFLMHY